MNRRKIVSIRFIHYKGVTRVEWCRRVVGTKDCWIYREFYVKTESRYNLLFKRISNNQALELGYIHPAVDSMTVEFNVKDIQ